MKLKIYAKSKHSNKKEEVEMVKRDGWVLSRREAFGDMKVDCKIELPIDWKAIREKAGFTQQEMSWVLGTSRPTWILMEKGKREVSLKEYLILSKTEKIKDYLPKI